MQVDQFNLLLKASPNASLQFILPSGDSIPSHFHVTEVGRVEKAFVDCGGTVRHSTSCQLQLWTANDFDHRLKSDKLAVIMAMADPILKADDLQVEVEYGQNVASLYSVDHVVCALGSIQIFLAGKQTDCLAKEKCGIGDGAGDCC